MLSETPLNHWNIGTHDLRIAAIVLSVNGILITSNRRDFDEVSGRIIEDWDTQ